MDHCGQGTGTVCCASMCARFTSPYCDMRGAFMLWCPLPFILILKLVLGKCLEVREIIQLKLYGGTWCCLPVHRLSAWHAGSPGVDSQHFIKGTGFCVCYSNSLRSSLEGLEIQDHPWLHCEHAARKNNPNRILVRYTLICWLSILYISFIDLPQIHT